MRSNLWIQNIDLALKWSDVPIFDVKGKNIIYKLKSYNI